MSSNVIPLFPIHKQEIVYKIPLFGDKEVRMTVAIINLFGPDVERKPYWCIPPAATEKNLKLYNPFFVIECLKVAAKSNLFSSVGRQIIDTILKNIQSIKLIKEA